jgi:hypothetical protein
MGMTVHFDKNDGSKPERMLAEAALHFEGAIYGPLDGLKLVGFSVWQSPEGGLYVTLPARAFGAGSERRYFDFVRSIDGDHKKTDALKQLVRAAWKEEANS